MLKLFLVVVCPCWWNCSFFGTYALNISSSIEYISQTDKGLLFSFAPFRNPSILWCCRGLGSGCRATTQSPAEKPSQPSIKQEVSLDSPLHCPFIGSFWLFESFILEKSGLRVRKKTGFRFKMMEKKFFLWPFWDVKSSAGLSFSFF